MHQRYVRVEFNAECDGVVLVVADDGGDEVQELVLQSIIINPLDCEVIANALLGFAAKIPNEKGRDL